MAYFATAVAVGATVVATGIYYALKPKPLPGIPHSPTRWLWGDLKSLLEAKRESRGETQFFGEHSNQYGPICQVLIGPWSKFVIVSDPAEVEDIMRRRYNEFEYNKRLTIGFGWTIPKGHISVPEGPLWRSHRKLMGPSMTPQYLAAMTPRISTNINRLLHLWEAKYQVLQSVGGAAFAAAPDIQLFTMDNISDIAIAETFGGISGAIKIVESLSSSPNPDDNGCVTFEFPNVPHHHAVRCLFEMMARALTSPFPKLAYYLHGFLNPRWLAAMKLMQDFLTHKIDAERRRATARKLDPSSALPAGITNSVLEMIFEREGKDSPDVMPDDELRDELLLFLLAGQDTTGGALSWAVKYLTEYPDVQRKLRTALMQSFHIPEDSPRLLSYTEAHSGDCPYLDAVVAEILRISVAGGFIPRQAKQDTHILNYFIPKGTPVLIMTGHVGIYDTIGNAPFYASLDHLRPKESAPRSTPRWAEDGKKFLPERWIDADGKFNGKMGPSYPFGGGMRTCFGQRLAMLQLKLIVAAWNLSFFFDRLPYAELGSWETKEVVIRHPLKTWIKLKKWEAT